MQRLVFGSLLLLIAVVGWVATSKQNRSESVQLKHTIETYVAQRLGVRDATVLVQLTMSPTSNATVVERLIPQKIAAKSTVIASNKSQQPMGQGKPAMSQSSAIDLPGMAAVLAPMNAPSKAAVVMGNSSAENREQQLLEQIYFNKEVQTVTIEPQRLAAAITIFLPVSAYSNAATRILTSGISAMLNPLNQFQLTVNVFPMQNPTFLMAVYSRYDQCLAWIALHPVLFTVILCLLVCLGCLIQYFRFLMALRLANAEKTVVLKESPPKETPKDPPPVAQSRPIISSTPEQLAAYFLTGERNEN